MVKIQILEHRLWHPGCVKRPRQPFTNQQRLCGMFQQYHIASDQGRGHRIDRRHIGVIPRRNDQHRPMRNPFDITLELFTILNADWRQRAGGDICHMVCALLKTTKFAAIAHRSPHLPGQLRHDLGILLSDDRHRFAHKRDTRVQRPRRPVILRRMRSRHRLSGSIRRHGRAFSIYRAINRRNTL